MSLLDNAIEQIDIKLLNSLDYGEERPLNNKYTLYHYTEEDVIVVNQTCDDEGNADWTELFQVLNDGSTITFEQLF